MSLIRIICACLQSELFAHVFNQNYLRSIDVRFPSLDSRLAYQETILSLRCGILIFAATVGNELFVGKFVYLCL